MEHRDQMNNEFSGKEIFLQNSVAEKEKPAIYSLEAEFSKAKANRDLKPQLIFLGFVFLLIGSTLLTVNYLERRSRQVEIDISDFEDLHLKEALGEAMKKEAELNRKKEELNIKDAKLRKLQSSYQSEVKRLKEEVQQSDNDKELLMGSQPDLKLKIKKQKEDLEAYQYALRMLLKEKKAAGCVTDPRRRKNILIFTIQKVSSEIVVDLYRSDDIYVGKIKLVPDKNGALAETVEVAKNQKIKPLDWFRIE